MALANPVAKTEILWDTWGVPHIFAKDAPELFHAFGWAQAASHGDLILRLYGQARGRAAEYWGKDFVESDKQARTVGIPTRAASWYGDQSDSMRRYLDAFAGGMNAYVQQHPDKISDEVKAVLPITGVDVLAHIQRLVHFTFLTASDTSATDAIAQWQAGSNAIAIAPQHSASGNAMLLANPHLPWSDRFLLYEADLHAPGVEVYGATLVGIPMLVFAFNEYLGWTHTINTHNGWGVYELTLAEGGYVFDSKVRPFETQTQTLKVKQADGSLRDEPLIINQAIQGPVVAQKGNKALALRVTGLDASGILEQYWDMVRAKNLTEFEAILQRLQLPMFTVMYGDRDGHILHLFNGRVPVRPQGDWNYWLKPVPGNTSATLWTKTHPYQDLPRVVDPKSGWLQNTNDPPWTTTFPQVLNPKNYPSYMAPRFMSFRTQRAVRMLLEDSKISFLKLIQDKFSTRMELADRILDDLLAATQQYGSQLAKEAATVLSAWDRQAEADSQGAVLFAFWAQAMDFGNPSANSSTWAKPWNELDPRNTPDGLANPPAAVATLEAVAGKVKSDYGRLDVPWGEVFRLRYQQAGVDLPASGGSGNLGIFQALYFAPSQDKRFQPFLGDTYIAAIEFSKPVRAQVLNTYGNASQPGNSHVGDQLALYARKQLRPVWRTRREIEANLESRQFLKAFD